MEKIRLTHIAKSFGEKEVLSDINLSIHTSETVILLGPSGSGKTTLLKLINRLIEPDNGTILIDGEDILTQKRELVRRKIGYVIQDTGLLPHLTTKRNIELIGRVTGKKVSTAKLDSLLELIGLNREVLEKYPNELSGGQQQRIGIARALGTDPDIILMDEPFSALDNITRGQLQDDFNNLKHLDNKTILLVTHDIQEAFKLGDRIVMLDQGVIQQVGTPHELLTNPSTSMVKEFLAKDRFILSLRNSKHNGRSALDILSDEEVDPAEKGKLMSEFFKKQSQ